MMEILNLVLFGAGLSVYYILHSVLADMTVKKFLTEKVISERYYRLAYNFLALLLLLPLVWFYLKIESKYFYEFGWFNYLGLTIVILGAISMLIALRQYDLSEFAGTQQLSTKNSKGFAPLKTDGFNSLVRHPLYLSGLLLLWGWFIFRPSYLFLVIVLVTTFYLYFGTILEEKKLVVAFGETYLDYQKRVWMLLPLGIFNQK